MAKSTKSKARKRANSGNKSNAIKKGPTKISKPRRKVASNAARKKKVTTNIIRSSGRRERFNPERMAQTTGRSGVPFLMARDVSKNISEKLESEENSQVKEKEKIVTSGQVRNMITKELEERNQQAIASSYTGQVPENTQKDSTLKQYESPIGSANTDQHEAYRGNKDDVMYDQSKRHISAT
jgi:hypothetical protein